MRSWVQTVDQILHSNTSTLLVTVGAILLVVVMCFVILRLQD